ncbi:ImmA/IrrE family metallo-endopeptidase [Desulfosporosinus sp. Sb-LF]|uniref:ImmA/IrrE family metallo-endopeptidase n=1 Tax=Desulfosporosinus sp. Sb-LF TaxID=2560027 RepID=UPI0013051858|nr:ImmA/IrrE family metallo-endopeptidase [Desulfosporosinus sp. Sb-LF]
MIYYKYSQENIEQKAEGVLREFDAERLELPKTLDVYDFIEQYLDVPYDWKNLTPDQSLLGLTAFNDGYWWVWPDGAKTDGSTLPEKLVVPKNTILIDNSVVNCQSKGRENFTVIHECFHQILHRKSFSRGKVDYMHSCAKKDFYANVGKKKTMTAIEIIEWQANASTAAFLMPRQAVRNVFLEKLELSTLPTTPIPLTFHINAKIYEMADLFNSSYIAMKYRLCGLNLLQNRVYDIDDIDLF